MEGSEIKVVTTPFIQEFLGEVENIDQGAFPPPTPIGDKETVVGKISPYCQKLSAMWRSLGILTLQPCDGNY